MKNTTKELTETRRLARNGILNLFGYILPLTAAILVIPLLINGMGKDRFGALTLIWTLFVYLSLFDLGLSRALTKMVAERLGLGRNDEIPELVWTASVLMFCLGALASILLWMVSGILINEFLNIPDQLSGEFFKSLLVVELCIPFIIVSIGLRGVLEAYQKFGTLNLIRIPLGIYLFCSPLIVLPFSKNLFHITAIIMVGRVAVGFVFLYFCVRTIPNHGIAGMFKRSRIKELLVTGGWMTVSNILNPIMIYMDRFLIAAILSLSVVAFYTTPNEVVTKLMLLPVALVAVMFPAISTSYSTDRTITNRIYETSLKHIGLLMFPISLGVIVFANEGTGVWLNKDFVTHSAPIFQWMAIGLFFLSVSQVPFALIQGAGRPDLTAKLHLIQLPIFLVFIAFMVQKNGLIGAAQIWTLRAFLEMILLLIIAKRFLPGKLEAGKLLAALGIFLIMSLNSLSIINQVEVKSGFYLVFVLLYPIFCWRLLLRNDEKESLKSLIPLRNGPSR